MTITQKTAIRSVTGPTVLLCRQGDIPRCQALGRLKSLAFRVWPPVLPELDVEKVRRWCRDRVPAKFADEVRLEVTTRGKSISIHECRPVWRRLD